MKIIIHQMQDENILRRQIILQDAEMIKKFRDLFLNPDIGDTEYFIYESVENYYQLDYYYEHGFKRIIFTPADLPDDRDFLRAFL